MFKHLLHQVMGILKTDCKADKLEGRPAEAECHLPAMSRRCYLHNESHENCHLQNLIKLDSTCISHTYQRQCNIHIIQARQWRSRISCYERHP